MHSLNFRVLPLPRDNFIALSVSVSVVILTPRISETSLKDRMVAMDFLLKWTFIGKTLRIDFLSKLISPLFVETVSLSCCFYERMSFTRTVLFDTLLVAHMYSSTHVYLIPALGCVMETPTCVRIAPV